MKETRPDSVRARAVASVLLVAVLLAACGGSRKSPPEGAPQHVILISLDTLRADRCGFNGYTKPTTPFLDSLAAQGVTFENHFSNSNNTLISHASMLTGLVPAAHATIDGGGEHKRRRLADAYDTLAERFRDAGYTTAAFTAHPAWLAKTFGLEQGFDHLESEWWDAASNSRAFLRWLDRESPEHLFAFLHFYDAHSEAGGRGGVLPYDSSAELIAQFAGPTPAGFTGTVTATPYMCCSRFLRAINEGEEPLPPPEHLRFISGLYDAGIAKLDADLANLFAELRRRGMLERTLVVITSDHGEEFMEHGQLLHGGYHDEIARVPLIVLPPFGPKTRAARITAVTRSIDIAPTMLDFAGLPPIGQGRSLRAAIVNGDALTDGDVLFGTSILRARDAQGFCKLGQETDLQFFYDLASDPGEQANLLGSDGFEQRSKARLEAMRERLAALQKTAQGIANSMAAKGGDAKPTLGAGHDQEELDKLGYTGK